MEKHRILQTIKGGLVVSCQALQNEPLHSPFIMAKMALAAKMGGAVGIRANGYDDIAAIKREVDLPVIGLMKQEYAQSEIYITPTLREVDRIAAAGAEIIAIDATARVRPNNQPLHELFSSVRRKYPDRLLMADISTFAEARSAVELGFDMVGTTLSGYTSYTRERPLPDFELMEELVRGLSVPVVAEGGVGTPEQFRKALALGVHTVVVGTAITRPMEITKKFLNAN